MRVWGYILLFSVGIAAFILILALVFNLVIAWSARRFSNKTLHTNLEALENLLPGKNCGACGCETCAEYARAVFELRKGTNCCNEGSAELTKQLSAQMDKFYKRMENDTPNEKDRWLQR